MTDNTTKLEKGKKGRVKWGKEHMSQLGKKGGKAKKGTKHKSTIDRERILEQAKDIVAGRTKKLIDTASMIAFGTIKCFVIKYDYIGKKRVARKPELVTDDETIANILYHEYADGEDISDDSEYYFVTTVDPNIIAIKELLDRTFGRATENKTITLEKGMGALLDEIEDEDEE